ncbi:MAG: hypothetical protein RI580_13820, partial [Halothece sp. Uz-M2-17]|nr:hypothetical protein [Halothece sp. Uz-M2-17]
MRSISRRQLLLYFPSGYLAFVSPFLLSCQSGHSKIMEQEGKAVNFLEEIRRLKEVAPQKASNQYQPPTTEELKQFQRLARAFFALDFKRVQQLAQPLGYELVKWRERATETTVLGLMETPNQQGLTRGWGSYFINPVVRNNHFIEAPHILFDRFAPEIASQVFLLSGARGFFMAGAHRNANGVGTADVCDPIASIFQVVHEAAMTQQSTTWQIHGFSDPVEKGFPKITQVVLSPGKSEPTPVIINLRSLLTSNGYTTYVYNELPPDHPLNQRLNGGVPSETFAPLAATENVQGI